MASTDEIDKMIDKEDWSQISEPALRKRIQNRISQRKLRMFFSFLGQTVSIH